MRAENPAAAASTAARLDPSRPSSRRPSDRARLRAKWEPLALIYRELAALLAQAEFNTPPGQPFEPDWDRYFEYERAGILKLWIARSPRGAIAGCAAVLIVHGLRSASTLFSFGDLFWLAPEWRGGLLGLRFLRSVEQAVRDLGVRVVRWETDDSFEPDERGRSRVAGLLERLGYEQIGTIMQKALTP